MTYAVEMLKIRKTFSGFVANDDITLQVKQGEIHALLGENGAGKTTLMNILFGLYEPDEGEIRLHGEKVNINSPNKANNLGIGMVHQHFMLVDKFTVAENIILGKEPNKFGFIQNKKAIQEMKGISDRYHLHVDFSALVRDISIGMEQRVEILKTLYRGADIIIFDEPTAVLTPQEINELIQIMRALTKEGKSIILITHKLKEIMHVCDRVTVIRRGKGIKTLNVSETNPQKLANMMVGREVDFTMAKKAAVPGEDVLEIKDLIIKESHGIESIRGLNLTVRAGEIVGLAGVDGNGQSELIAAISGLTKVSNGTITLNKQSIENKKPRKITETGLGYIPEDRHKYGLVLEMSVGENITLQTYYQKPFSNKGFLNYEEMYKCARDLINEYDIRTKNEYIPAKALSGGNQQKMIIGREISRDPAFLIAAQPTRGLDVGAIEFIHRRLIEQRDKGRAILFVSFELDEILKISDRIAVIYEGKIIAIVNPKETTEQELGLLMAGSRQQKMEAVSHE